MVQLGLLLPNKYRLLSVAAILDVFETVNRIYKPTDEGPFFRITVFQADSQPQISIGTYTAQPIRGAAKQDILLVPAFNSENIKQSITENTAFVPWLKAQYQSGAEDPERN